VLAHPFLDQALVSAQLGVLKEQLRLMLLLPSHPPAGHFWQEVVEPQGLQSLVV
jgi:hypothetical protein